MKIKELLDSPEKWTKGWVARDIDYHPVSPLDKKAVSFCLLGSIIKCYHYYTRANTLPYEINCKMSDYITKLGFDCVSNFNDSPKTTFEDISKMLEELDV